MDGWFTPPIRLILFRDLFRALPCLQKPDKNSFAKRNLLMRSHLASVLSKRLRTIQFGQYLRIADLKTNDIITIEFPMLETTETWTIPHKKVWGSGPDSFVHTCRFKGNTLIEITPPIHKASFGRRKHYLEDKAPVRKVNRYVTEKVLRW